MLLLALQIYFSIRAFKNGWRKRVFIPWTTVLGISVLVGLVIGAEGKDVSDVTPVLIVLEAGLTLVLGFMAKHAPAQPAALLGDIHQADKTTA